MMCVSSTIAKLQFTAGLLSYALPMAICGAAAGLVVARTGTGANVETAAAAAAVGNCRNGGYKAWLRTET